MDHHDLDAEQRFNRLTEQLRESERRYRALLQTLPTIAWEADATGMSTLVSDRWHEYTGLSPDEGTGMGWEKAVHPDDLADSMAAWREAMQAGRPFEGRHRLRGADGVYRSFLVRSVPVRDDAGVIVRWAGSATDIDQMVRSEALLRVSEHRFRATFENAAVGIAHVSPSGGWIRVNQRLCEILGYTRDELLALQVCDVMHPSDRDEPSWSGSSTTCSTSRASRETRCTCGSSTCRWPG